MRRQVSLLLDHGHPCARFYPVGMVQDEYVIVVERLDSHEATRAALTQMAVASLLDKKAGENFSATLKGLSNG